MSKASEVFCVHGAEPEVLAYAMAKYSRSSLSLRESIADITAQKAETFLDSFYFAYGHKSIADMAHVPMAIENISLLAAIEVVDESRWDGQERSTRYQDFSEPEFYIPPSEDLTFSEMEVYHTATRRLFKCYHEVFESSFAQLTKDNPRPEAMTEESYTRALRARAFDIARYLLPLNTLTSVGQVTSARALEGQISRLMGSPYKELTTLAEQMKQAASTESYSPGTAAAGPALAPTLVKYTQPSAYLRKSRHWAERTAADVGLSAQPDYLGHQDVRMITTKYSVEQELLATILYEVSSRSFESILGAVTRLNASRLDELLDKAVQYRGPFDELARTWRVGSGFIFDIHMDIGGFRDLHRHRRCVQVFQDYTSENYAVPAPIVGTAVEVEYKHAMREMQHYHSALKHLLYTGTGWQPEVADYILPLGVKRRFLMKMDLAELAYITELRTGPAGHFSYRTVAFEMYKQFAAAHPQLASHFRVTDVDQPIDLLKR